MHRQRLRWSRSLSSSDRKKYSATHTTGKFPVSSRLRSMEEQNVKNRIYHSCRKVAIAKCRRILRRELKFDPGDRWYGYDRGMKKFKLRRRVQTEPFKNIQDSPSQTQNLKFLSKDHLPSEKCKKVTFDPLDGYLSPSWIKQRVWWRVKPARRGAHGRSGWNQAS